MHYAQYCRLAVHVGASNRTVIRAAHRLLNPVSRRAATARKARHEWLRAILREHADAQRLCRQFRF